MVRTYWRMLIFFRYREMRLSRRGGTFSSLRTSSRRSDQLLFRVDVEEVFHIDLVVTIMQFRLRLASQLEGVGSAKLAAVGGTLV
jgi:hypothetical protein